MGQQDPCCTVGVFACALGPEAASSETAIVYVCQAVLPVLGLLWAPLPIQNGDSDGQLGPRLLHIQSRISVALVPWVKCQPGHLEGHLGHCTIWRPTHFLSTLRIKKIWWDQIPTPARSPLVAIIIQDTQVRRCRCSTA